MVSIWAAEASTWKADVTKATQSFIDIALNFLPYKALWVMPFTETWENL